MKALSALRTSLFIDADHHGNVNPVNVTEPLTGCVFKLQKPPLLSPALRPRLFLGRGLGPGRLLVQSCLNVILDFGELPTTSWVENSIIRDTITYLLTLTGKVPP
jgi:hypothetical protein